jgi:hypothetical protein
MDSEIDDILRELLREPGALGAAVAREGAPALDGIVDARLVRAPLGEGAELVVAASDPPPPELAAAIERAARELRSWMRRNGDQVPDHELTGRAPRSRALLRKKIDELLGAFAAVHAACGVALLRRGEVMATGGALDAAQLDRLTFLRKRIDAEAARQRGRSSHAEILGSDVYACSFWFDAYLVMYFDRPYAVDFVRFRARAVARELSAILPHLDDDPTTPATILPLPPRT